MKRASNTFSVLQATAVTVAIATLLWSFGLPSIHFVDAANVTFYSDTLSSSEPSVVSNHTIVFSSPTGVTNGQTITIDFADGPFGMSTVDFTDIDMATTSGEFSLADDCSGSEMASATTTGGTTLLTITLCAGDGGLINALGTTTIEIGLHANTGTAGDAQLINPTAASRQLPLVAGADSGETRVAIVDTVLVTAAVDTQFQFTIAGVAAGQTVNGTTTGGVTSATLIPFGILSAGSASTAAQDLTVSTNAKNGFVVTVTADGQLTSGSADIDGFRNGNYDSTAVPWEAPTGSVADEDTWGHWGITSDDPTVTSGLTDEFDTAGDGQDYVSASTSPVEVFRHTGPINGTGVGEGITRVGYSVQISALQEAAEDYQAILTYVATPVF